MKYTALFVLVVAASVLQAQSTADSTALARSIADVVTTDSHKSVDHRPPFVLRPDSNPRWSELLEQQLSGGNRLLLAPVAGEGSDAAVHLSVGKVTLAGDTARVILTWSRCLAGEKGMNFWRHQITYEFTRVAGAWRSQKPIYEVDGEGRC